MTKDKPKFVIVFVLFFVTILFNSKNIIKADLNFVYNDELQKIRGIGEKRASAIIQERNKGLYVSFNDVDQRNETIGKVLTQRLAEKFTIKN